MPASELPLAERVGETTWKFEACLRGGAAAAFTAPAPLAAAFTDWIEPASRITDPRTLPPVSGP